MEKVNHICTRTTGPFLLSGIYKHVQVHRFQTYFIPVLLLIFGETHDSTSECGELYEIIYGEHFSRVCGGIFDVEYCEVYEKKLLYDIYEINIKRYTAYATVYQGVFGRVYN
eukprot:453973_1